MGSDADERPSAQRDDCLWLLRLGPDQVHRPPSQGPLIGTRTDSVLYARSAMRSKAATFPAMASPMMQQFEAAKARCPGALVLFRMGDFYELFGDDAREAATLLDLQSITVGLFGTNVSTIPLTVSIYADSAGNPAATPLFTSAVTQVGTTDKYTFSFTGASLSANTTYWVVPNGGSWYYNAGTPPAPMAHNASGYTYVGGRESLSTGVTPASSVWDVGGNNRYSVSITAVPEPSTLTLAGIGLAMVVGLEVRRRRRQVELV